MNKKESILFQIALFFTFIFVIINFLGITQIFNDFEKNKFEEIKRFDSALKVLMHDYFKLSKEELNERIAIFDMELSDLKKEDILKSNHKKLNSKDDFPIEIIQLNDKKYIFFRPKEHKKPPFDMPPFDMPPLPFKDNMPKNLEPRNDFFMKPEFKIISNLVLIDKADDKNQKYFWLIILILIDMLLISFFFFIKNKLNPLEDLKNHMIELSKGNFKISTKTTKNDEISQVANEFDKAISQLRELKESRNLFLRNIMHELKTPITKGKLLSDMLEENEDKYTLIKVFYRLEYLLGEFARVEELTSGKIVLDKNRYFGIDLVNQALDILLIEEDSVEVYENFELLMEVDFELFSIALKNLIDNGIKYGKEKPKIYIEKDGIKIENRGEKLKKDITEYYKPFNHDYDNLTHSGLGLGLYISNNIIKIHDLKLVYNYEEDLHTFTIVN